MYIMVVDIMVMEMEGYSGYEAGEDEQHHQQHALSVCIYIYVYPFIYICIYNGPY